MGGGIKETFEKKRGSSSPRWECSLYNLHNTPSAFLNRRDIFCTYFCYFSPPILDALEELR